MKIIDLGWPWRLVLQKELYSPSSLATAGLSCHHYTGLPVVTSIPELTARGIRWSMMHVAVVDELLKYEWLSDYMILRSYLLCFYTCTLMDRPTKSLLMIEIGINHWTLACRGRFRHVQHVRSNRGHQKKGHAHTCGIDLWVWWGVYTIQQTSSKLPANVFKIHVLMLDVCWIV